mmetsp:Transcript_27297/g.87757  ORF Transcript_27297/g.87757 Transcript_27297/m.87757 type:complete len:385 (+) Transcript_27297:289-1443(+)
MIRQTPRAAAASRARSSTSSPRSTRWPRCTGLAVRMARPAQRRRGSTSAPSFSPATPPEARWRCGSASSPPSPRRCAARPSARWSAAATAGPHWQRWWRRGSTPPSASRACSPSPRSAISSPPHRRASPTFTTPSRTCSGGSATRPKSPPPRGQGCSTRRRPPRARSRCCGGSLPSPRRRACCWCTATATPTCRPRFPSALGRAQRSVSSRGGGGEQVPPSQSLAFAAAAWGAPGDHATSLLLARESDHLEPVGILVTDDGSPRVARYRRLQAAMRHFVAAGVAARCHGMPPPEEAEARLSPLCCTSLEEARGFCAAATPHACAAATVAAIEAAAAGGADDGAAETLAALNRPADMARGLLRWFSWVGREPGMAVAAWVSQHMS